MALLLAPYNNAMRLGQGFNSYTQQICVDDAVIIDPTRPENVVTNDGTTMRILSQSMGKPSAWSRQKEVYSAPDIPKVVLEEGLEDDEDDAPVRTKTVRRLGAKKGYDDDDEAEKPVQTRSKKRSTAKKRREDDTPPKSEALQRFIVKNSSDDDASLSNSGVDDDDDEPEGREDSDGGQGSVISEPQRTDDEEEKKDAGSDSEKGSESGFDSSFISKSSSSRLRPSAKAKTTRGHLQLVPQRTETKKETETERYEREERRKEEKRLIREQLEYERQLRKEAREEEKTRRDEKRAEEKARREEQRKKIEEAARVESYSKEDLEKLAGKNEFVERFCGMLENNQEYYFDATGSRGPSQTVTYTSRFVDRLSDVTEAMNISGSLSIKAGNIGGSGAGAFIDSDKFKDSDLNFYLSVKVVNQTINFKDALFYNPLDSVNKDNFREVYGDSFISGFIEGGEFNAIVSIKILNKAKKTDIAAQAKVAFTTGSVDVTAEAKVQSARQNIETNTETTIQVSWSGGGHIKPMEQQWDIKSLMQAAARFPDLVADCPQRTYAILTKYDALRSFVALKPAGYTKLQYESAQLYTNGLMESYMTFKALHKRLGADIFAVQGKTKEIKTWPNPPSNSGTAKHGPFDASLMGLEAARKEILKNMSHIVNKVDEIEKNPKKATDDNNKELFQSPIEFEARIPLVQWTDEANPDYKVPLDGTDVLFQSEDQKKAETAKMLAAKRARKLYPDSVDPALHPDEKASLDSLHRIRAFIGEHIQVSQPVGSTDKGSFFNNIEFLQPDWMVTSISVWMYHGAVGAITVQYDNGLILTRGKPQSGGKVHCLEQFATGERITSGAIEVGQLAGNVSEKRVLSLRLYTNRGRSVVAQAGERVPGSDQTQADGFKYEAVETVYFDAPFQNGSLKGFFGRSDETRHGIQRLGLVWGDLERAVSVEADGRSRLIATSGDWHTGDIKEKGSNTETIRFSPGFIEPPRMIYGIFGLDIEVSGKTGPKIQTEVSKITEDDFEVKTKTFNEGVLYKSSTSWLTLPENEINFNYGTFDTKQISKSSMDRAVVYVQFATPYETLPTCPVVWFTGFDMEKATAEQKYYRLRTYVEEFSCTGFTLIVEAKDSPKFNSAQVGWCAWDAKAQNQEVQSNIWKWDKSRKNTVSITWSKDVYKTTPALFAAVCGFETSTTRYFRAKGKVQSNSPKSADLEVGSWDDSDVPSYEIRWFGIDSSFAGRS